MIIDRAKMPEKEKWYKDRDARSQDRFYEGVKHSNMKDTLVLIPLLPSMGNSGALAAGVVQLEICKIYASVNPSRDRSGPTN